MALQKTKNFSRLRWPRDHKLISLLVIVVLLIGGYFVYEAVALRMNRHDFEQARTAIDTIYSDIVSQVGQPDDYKKERSCSRPYQEFTGYGSPNCDVGFSLIYGTQDEVKANAILQKVQSEINMHQVLKHTSQSLSYLTDKFVINANYHASSDTYSLNGLKCVANYVFDTPDETTLTIKDNSKKPLEITFGCYGPARQAYYPLAY
jgi:hypothetical protein